MASKTSKKVAAKPAETHGYEFGGPYVDSIEGLEVN